MLLYYRSAECNQRNCYEWLSAFPEVHYTGMAPIKTEWQPKPRVTGLCHRVQL